LQIIRMSRTFSESAAGSPSTSLGTRRSSRRTAAKGEEESRDGSVSTVDKAEVGKKDAKLSVKKTKEDNEEGASEKEVFGNTKCNKY